MAYFVDEGRTVVARILYDGLGMAGKTRSLHRVRQIFADRAGPVFAPEASKERTLYFDWLELEAGYFDDCALRLEVLTVPGQWAYAHRRWLLLQSTDAVIAVVDSTPSGIEHARYAMAFLRRTLAAMGGEAPPIVVQAHKQDLPGAKSAAEVRALFGLAEDVPIFGTSAETGEGIRQAFMLAARRAREHVRRRLGDRPPETLRDEPLTPQALHARLREADLSDAHSQAQWIVEQVLDEMGGRL